MNKQITLSAFSDELAKVRTKKKEFVTQMDRIISCGEWKTLIEPYYYKGELSNKPYKFVLKLRLYILQNRYNHSDEGTVAEVINSRAFSEFSGGFQQSSTRWRYIGTVSKSMDEARLAATVVCSSGRYADRTRIDPEKEYGRRFHHNLNSVLREKRGKDG